MFSADTRMYSNKKSRFWSDAVQNARHLIRSCYFVCSSISQVSQMMSQICLLYS